MIPVFVDNPTFLSEARPMKAPKVRPHVSLARRARFYDPSPPSTVSECSIDSLTLGSGMSSYCKFWGEKRTFNPNLALGRDEMVQDSEPK